MIISPEFSRFQWALLPGV